MSITPPTDPRACFTHRVDDYRRFRPGYPDALVERLRSITALRDGAVIADVGSGTGISAELFLRHGYTVAAVEPNGPMRGAAEEALAARFGPRFRSVPGCAESTGLGDASVDMVIAAQAFHWFDPETFAAECRRILRPAGWVVLIWNDRWLDSTPFLIAYEALLQRFGTDYAAVAHRNIGPDQIAAFFNALPSATAPIAFTLDNAQRLDVDGLRGRTRSSSYVPAPNDPRHAPMMEELDQLFATFATDGHVEIDYDVTVSVGSCASPFSQQGPRP
ncbi:MAG TPA: class I SAM-dependent methyltransferase [Phycisphaerales bacterium]|nr:class I SAM-dependent methyltransferase [Phycisphaerales bacterium]HMP36963.1 class I SAM-dependent methyltransferase [Phycisphaerales bacterium]